MALSGAFRPMSSPLWSLWTKVNDPRSKVHCAISTFRDFSSLFHVYGTIFDGVSRYVPGSVFAFRLSAEQR